MRYMGWGYGQLRGCPWPEYLEILAAIERQAREANQRR